MQTKMKLLSLHTGHETEGYKEVVLKLYHDNGDTTLDQQLILSRKPFQSHWEARIKIDEFPEGLSLPEAAIKMGEWLTRMGKAISNNIDVCTRIETVFQDIGE